MKKSLAAMLRGFPSNVSELSVSKGIVAAKVRRHYNCYNDSLLECLQYVFLF